MAGFTRTNGDFLPVAVVDNATIGANGGIIGNGYVNPGNINAVSTANTVQPAGPTLVFFTLAGNAATLDTYTPAVFQAVEQFGTVMMYEANTAPTDDTIAFAMYPIGLDTANIAANVTLALDVAGAANNTVTLTNTALFTN